MGEGRREDPGPSRPALASLQVTRVLTWQTALPDGAAGDPCGRGAPDKVTLVSMPMALKPLLAVGMSLRQPLSHKGPPSGRSSSHCLPSPF